MVVLMVYLVLLGLLVELALRRLPGKMPIVGSNSAAIASCCRPASRCFVESSLPNGGFVLAVSDRSFGDTGGRQVEKLPYGKIKWGMLRDESAKMSSRGPGQPVPVDVLGFGTASDDMMSPIDGTAYG